MPRSPAGFDPFILARRQQVLDVERTRRLPHLLPHRRERMRASPFAFFRGSNRLFVEMLAARPDLAAGPPGRGWVVGDMHMENVGAYAGANDSVRFDLNDFDDAVVAPVRFDVVRLATSVVLVGRAAGLPGGASADLVEALLAAYDRAARGASPASPRVPAVERLLAKAAGRSKRQLLDQRAPIDRRRGHRRFLRGARYVELPAGLRRQVPALVAAYRRALGHDAAVRVVDAVQRIAGTGSLGLVRIAAVVDDDRIVELKEAMPSALAGAPGVERRPPAPAARVVAAAQSLPAEAPRHLVAVAHAASGMQLVGRPLSPRSDKLDLAALGPSSQLADLVRAVGIILGRAHRRGGLRGYRALDERTRDRTIDAALALAGAFEGAYLAYSRGS